LIPLDAVYLELDTFELAATVPAAAATAFAADSALNKVIMFIVVSATPFGSSSTGLIGLKGRGSVCEAV
jgi:hypothetical protein